MAQAESTRLLSNDHTGGNSSHESPTHCKSRLRLSEKVYDYIVSNIASGRFVPSERISQRAIASQLSVSHIPVREAMEKLLQHGWIDRYPQKGTYVKNHTVEEILEIYQVREFYEAEAVRALVSTITEEQIRCLREIEKELQRASSDNDTRRYVDLDIQFHAQMIQFLHNKKLNSVYDSVLLQCHCFMMAGAVRVSLVWMEGMEEHLDLSSHGMICDALENRDAELAEQLIRKHIQMSCSLAITIKERSNPVKPPILKR